MNEKIRPYLQTGQKNLILIYILYFGAILIPVFPFLGIFAFLGAMFARSNLLCSDKVWQSHYRFAFRTFCIGGVGAVITTILTFILKMPLLYIFIFTWFVVRSIIAFKYLMENKPYPNPLTLGIK